MIFKMRGHQKKVKKKLNEEFLGNTTGVFLYSAEQYTYVLASC